MADPLDNLAPVVGAVDEDACSHVSLVLMLVARAHLPNMGSRIRSSRATVIAVFQCSNVTGPNVTPRITTRVQVKAA